MFARFLLKARQCGRFLRVVLIALMAMLTGCDEKVAWKGVATVSKDAEHSPDQNSRNVSNVEPR